MKKKLLMLLCAGMLMTGCADKGSDGQKASDAPILDLDGDTWNNDVKAEQTAVDDSDAHDTAQIEENKEEQASTQADNIENVQNDENIQDIYLQFVNNEISVIVGSDYPQNDYRIFNLERGNAYTFAELEQYVNQSYFDPEFSEKTSYDYAQYTYVECPDNSDSENFLIKFVGLNIYAQGDDSFVVYVITEDNGKLYLTGEYECWARSYTEQFRNGLCSNGGSSGAGDHYAGMSAILSDGKITDIYWAEILSGWWTNYVNEEIYSEVFGENTETLLYVSIYTIGEDKYYTYDLSECTDDQIILCESYINRCRDEAGINWITDEEIQEAVRKRCSSLGIEYNALEQQEKAKWTDV